jgi:hypothetical protein
VNRSKQKGTAFESLIVAYLRANGVLHAERRALNGAVDKGDIAGIPSVVIEAKNCQRIELAQWVDEANQEALNDGSEIGVVWAKRKGRAAAEHGYIVMDPRTLMTLLRAGGYIPEATP